jgi:hypothetical protein
MRLVVASAPSSRHAVPLPRRQGVRALPKSSPRKGAARRKAQTFWCPRPLPEHGGRLPARHTRRRERQAHAILRRFFAARRAALSLGCYLLRAATAHLRALKPWDASVALRTSSPGARNRARVGQRPIAPRTSRQPAPGRASWWTRAEPRRRPGADLQNRPAGAAPRPAIKTPPERAPSVDEVRPR